MLVYPQIIFFDFDGVLTDNSVWVDQYGVETVKCSRSDGLGFRALKRAGIRCFVVSTEANGVVSARCAKLDIPCCCNVTDKGATVSSILLESNLDASCAWFIGNDVNDISGMNLCSYVACPSDSHLAVKQLADLVIPVSGGDGVVRWLAEVYLNLECY